MPVVLLTAALAILVGVVVVAIGRGGELTMFRADVPPHPVALGTAAQVAAFRPPPAFLGYNAQATDDALHRVALAVAQRDAELARLRGELAAARSDSPVVSGQSGPPGRAAPGDADREDGREVLPGDRPAAGETGELSR